MTIAAYVWPDIVRRIHRENYRLIQLANKMRANNSKNEMKVFFFFLSVFFFISGCRFSVWHVAAVPCD